MQLTIPDEVIHAELVSQLVSTVMTEMDKRFQFLNKTQELSPYPKKSELKRILKIGDQKLSEWEAKGLKFQYWSLQDVRVERSELQRFLKETFEV